MLIEISLHPEVLYERFIPVTDLSLLGRRLYDSVSLVDPAAVLDTSLEQWPEGFKIFERRLVGGEYRTFLKRDEADSEKREYVLADRIKSVMEHGGWLHLMDRYAYRIKAGMIVEFGIKCGGALAHFQTFSKQEIIERFGNPDFIKEQEDDDGDLFRTDFVYTRGIRVAFDDWDGVLDRVNVGESLVYPE